MAVSWDRCVVHLIVAIQACICVHLYFSHLAVVSKLDNLLLETSINSRSRREIRSLDEANVLQSNETIEASSTEITSRPVPSENKHHRKSSRVNVEKYFQSTESTTSLPVYVRSSRTKPTGGKNRGNNRQHKAVISEFDERRSAVLKDESSYVNNVPPAAIHFEGDTSNYSIHRHQHYAGNGRIRVSGVYSDWRPAHWVNKIGSQQYFDLNGGKVTVNKGGLYVLYAQIHYADIQEVNCFRAIHNGSVVAQCCSTTPHIRRSENHEIKANTCSLLTTLYLRPFDQIWLTNVHERFVILSHEKSYFGLVQLSATGA